MIGLRLGGLAVSACLDADGITREEIGEGHPEGGQDRGRVATGLVMTVHENPSIIPALDREVPAAAVVGRAAGFPRIGAGRSGVKATLFQLGQDCGRGVACHHHRPPPSIQDSTLDLRHLGHLPAMKSGRGTRPADRWRSIHRRETPNHAATSSSETWASMPSGRVAFRPGGLGTRILGRLEGIGQSDSDRIDHGGLAAGGWCHGTPAVPAASCRASRDFWRSASSTVFRLNR